MNVSTQRDELFPDAEVRKEVGGISEMTAWRWDRDPVKAQQGWPPPVRIGSRKYRSRKAIEAFKINLLKQALELRSGQAA